MKHTILFFSLLLLPLYAIHAQNVGIGTASPHNSAKLQIEATNKGLLVPRISIPNLNAAAPVSSPATALLVYNTNASTGLGYYYWDGSKWVRFHDQNMGDHDWYEVGTTSAPNAINDNIFTQGTVGIGTNSPNTNSQLHIQTTGNNNAIMIGDGPFPSSGNQDNIVFSDTNNNTGNRLIRWLDGQGNFTSQIGGYAGNGTPIEEHGSMFLRGINGITFRTATGNSRMFINPAGNVGIGTTQPLGPLHVYNTTPYSTNNSSVNNSSIVLYGAVQNALGQHFGGITWASSSQRKRAGISSVMEHTDADYLGLAFWTQGTDGPGPMRESMRISHDGHVGIGTTSPSSKLHIVDSSTIHDKLLVTSDNTSSNLAQISLLNTTRSGGITLGYVNNFNTYGDPGENYIYSSANMQGLNIMNNNTSGSGGHIALFSSGNHLSTPTLYLSDNDDVGIGTTGPIRKLDTRGSFFSTGEAMDLSGSRVYAEFSGKYTNVYPNGAADGHFRIFSYAHEYGTNRDAFVFEMLDGNDTYGDGGILFRARGTAGASLDLLSMLTNNGNVGVGVKQPINKFQVDGDARIGVINTSASAQAAGYGNRLYFSGGPATLPASSDNTDILWMARYNESQDRTIFRVNIGDNSSNDDAFQIGSTLSGTYTPRFHLSNGGNVGIGTTSPSQRLEVCGNAKIVGQIQANSSNLTAGLTCSSDRRLKKNIVSYSNALATIQTLEGKQYNWRTKQFKDRGFDERIKFGFIAQEVETILPELVYEDEQGFKSVDYIQIIPILTTALQEQQVLVDEANSKNQDLAAELAILKQENKQIKAQLETLNSMKAELNNLKNLLTPNAQK